MGHGLQSGDIHGFSTGDCTPTMNVPIHRIGFLSVCCALAAWLSTGDVNACSTESDGSFDGDGLRHGKWRIVHCDGIEASGTYRHGDHYGPWKVRYPDGMTGESGYSAGLKDGAWVYRYPDGSRTSGNYLQGRLDGLWTLTGPGGAVVERECWNDGLWMADSDLCAR